MEWIRRVGRLFIIIAMLLIVTVLLVFYAMNETKVIRSSDMAPSLRPDDSILISRIAYITGSPQRGDLVAVNPSESNADDVVMIKRVIALGGETVRVHNGRVWVNNRALKEPYVAGPAGYEYGPVIVPQNCLFVLGDNRDNSYDSHLWNYWITPSNLRGKVTRIYWPLSRFGAVGEPLQTKSQPE